MANNKTTRIACFYRVSTKKQVGRDNDLPLQENACRTFATQKGWTIVHEYYERGVSGYKKEASKRDVLQEALMDIRNKRFDILLVYMFDRLGRKEEETPFILQEIVKQGVRAWSVEEGEQRFDNHTDKLLNYIRFWQASGESEKTSIRVKERRRQMAQEGVWGGGNAPYGFRLVHKGRIGAKNRLLYDMEIDPIRADVVKEIFRLTRCENWGAYRIANHLNETITGRAFKKWSRVTVADVLKNITYTGRLHVGQVVTPSDERLRIISDDDFQICQLIRENRQTRPSTYRKDAFGNSLPSKADIHGARLLKGFLICGGCGGKMTGTYSTENRSGVQRTRPIYRCYNSSTKANGCTGQVTYNAAEIDATVLKEVEGFIKSLGDCSWSNRKRRPSNAGQFRQRLSSLQHKKATLQEETFRALTGESDFDKSHLNEMLNNVNAEIAEVNAQIQDEEDMNTSNERALRSKKTEQKNIISAFLGFERCSAVERNIVLSQIINSVTVFRRNPSEQLQINIDFKISKNQYEATDLEQSIAV